MIPQSNRTHYCRLCGMKINDGCSDYCPECRKKIKVYMRQKQQPASAESGSGFLGIVITLLLLLFGWLFKK